MLVFFLTVLLFVAAWFAVGLKSSRPDGTALAGIHPDRRLLLHVVPTRQESTLLFEDVVRAESLLSYIERANERFSCDTLHCLIGALARAIAHDPGLNRFVKAKRLYERKRRFVTFALERVGENAPRLVANKLEMLQGETFEQLCSRISTIISIEEHARRSFSSREQRLVARLPSPLLALLSTSRHWLDEHNLLPGFLTGNDPSFTSACVIDMGRVNGQPSFRQLSNWGTCSFVLIAGSIANARLGEPGQTVSERTLELRYSWDSRIDDGVSVQRAAELIRQTLENPFELLGCLKHDGADAVALDTQTGAAPPRRPDELR